MKVPLPGLTMLVVGAVVEAITAVGLFLQGSDGSQVFMWIAGGLATLILGLLGALLKRVRDFQDTTSTFIAKVETVLLGFQGSGGMIQKVDNLLVKDSVADVRMETRLQIERHSMREERQVTLSKFEVEFRDIVKRIQDQLDRRP